MVKSHKKPDKLMNTWELVMMGILFFFIMFFLTARFVIGYLIWSIGPGHRKQQLKEEPYQTELMNRMVKSVNLMAEPQIFQSPTQRQRSQWRKVIPFRPRRK